MKQVLIIYYSQSGQLLDIAQQMVHPLAKDPKYKLTYYEIKMQNPYPFPWDSASFFNVFPETFAQQPQPLLPPDASLFDVSYDLVLFFYQVWYLTPSLPVVSFLKSTYAQKLLANTPVVTISGSRNMWVMAQEKMKKMLQSHQADLVGNIALVDRHINLVSVITIVDWMFSGKKKNAYGFFPLPGVSAQDIAEADKFGSLIAHHLQENKLTDLQPALIETNAIDVRWFLVSMDKKGNKMFGMWSALLLKYPKQRKRLIRIFYLYLFLAIWIVSPVVHLIETLLYPLFYRKIQKEKKYFQGINL